MRPLFDHIAHERMSLLLEAAEDVLIDEGVCTREDALEYLTALYIAETGKFLGGGSCYLQTEERVAGWLFIQTITSHPKTKKYRKFAIELGRHIATHTPLYFPRYFEVLTKAYIEVLRTVEDLTAVMSDGVILLAAGTLPGLRTDLRREFKRRGLAYDKALVPDDVLEGRMTRDRVRPAQIAGWPATR